MSDERYETGLGIRREVLGDAYVGRALENVDGFNADFQRLDTEYCRGASWGREGRSRRQRSLNVLCRLAALNWPQEFEIYFRGALRNGCSVDELRETLTQIAIYAGIPAGVEAFRIGRKVLAETASEADG